MKRLAVVVACAVLVGCDYVAPLVSTPEMDIDRAVVGLWQRSQGEGQVESLLVLPLGKREYLVSFPAGSSKAMFARACLCKSADRTLVQLEWVGTAEAEVPADGRVFQFADYVLVGDTITIRLLNPKAVNRDVGSAADLAKAIADNKENPDLFREKMVFTKVKD